MTEAICTLGYHSHRGWVIRPQIFLLYAKVLMNKESYDSAIARGESKESTFDWIVSQLLKEYEHQGLIELKNYESFVTAEDKELVDHNVEWWMKKLPKEISKLLQAIYATQADVWEERLQYLSPNEPAYSKTLDDIDTFRQWKSRAGQKEFNIADKEILIHYLQQVMLTNKISSGTDMPIFEWSANMKLRGWMLSILPLPETQRKLELQSIEEGTRVQTLNALVEVIVEDQSVIDDKQVADFLKKRSQLRGVREKVDAVNKSIWAFVKSQTERGYFAALDSFMATLKLQAEELKKELRSVELEKSVSDRKKIVTSAAGILTEAASAIASLFVPVVPGLAKTVVDKMVEKDVSRVGDKLVERKYPDIAWAMIYQDVFKESLTKRTHLSVKIDSFHNQHAPEYSEKDICDILGINKAQLYRIEEQGLVPPASRDRYNRRIYTPDHLEKLMGLLLSSE